MMPRVTAGLAEHHPGIELDFMEGSHAFLERTLREGSCEIAVLYNYEFHRGRVPEDFTVHVVAAVPPHLVLPAGHRLARRDAVHLEEVLAETLILFDLEPGGEYFLGIFHQLGLTPQIRLRTASYEVVRELVARGLGYSLLTQKTAITTSYERHAFVTIPLADQLPALRSVVADRLGPAHEEGPGIPGPVPGVVRPDHAGLSRVAPVADRA